MKIIRCTQKLLKLIDIQVNEYINMDNKLNEWYANLIWIERRKCLLFCHENTLFSFLVVDVRRHDLKNIETLFQNNFQKALKNLQIPDFIIGKLLSRLEGFIVCRTKNKQLLGSMNDYAYQYKTGIEYHGGLNNCNIDEIVQNVNDAPMGQINYESGNRLMLKLIESLST